MVWRIDATDEWTNDESLADYAEETGIGSVYYDEAGLIRLVEQLEDKVRQQGNVFQNLYREIEEKCQEGFNSSPLGKNAYFNLIMHVMKQYEAQFNK